MSLTFIVVMLFLFWSPPQPHKTSGVAELHTTDEDIDQESDTDKPSSQTDQNTAQNTATGSGSGSGSGSQQQKPLVERKPHACPETFFTAADILAHSKCDFNKGNFDLWLVINENVYDVTDWALYHPGGIQICTAAGVDGTKFFKGSYHPAWVNQQELPKWCIGKLLSGEINALVAKN